MNCLHIASGDLWAGAEVSAYELAAELARRPGVEVGAVVLNPGTLESKLRQAGVRTWLIEEQNTSLPALVRRTKKVVTEFAPDVIHTHRYKEHLVGAVLSAATEAAHVRSAHGLNPRFTWSGGQAGVGAMVDEAIADWAGSTWIVVSEDLARRMPGLRRSLHVVPNGISPSLTKPNRAALHAATGGADAGNPWFVGFAGRLEDVKRPDRFLRMMAALPDQITGRRVHGVMMGDGSMAGRLRGIATELGLHGRVSFLGHRDGADALVAALDVLVITSDHEGLPMVLLEAMRSGVPVAATAVGGVPEALGQSPWIVAPEDEPGLARGVTTLLSDPVARVAWSTELADRFRQRFTIAATADRVIEVYESVLSTQPARSHGRRRGRP